MKGVRADIRLVELGLAESRERARSLIMSGEVFWGGRRIDKAGESIAPDAVPEVRSGGCPFVSRGGYKLEKPLEKYAIDISGAVALDVGASTGGFTDCMLKHGARRVYSVDVGYGQLDWRLRSDPRVTVMERTNARFMERSWFDERPDFATMDVSFISIRLILPHIFECLSEDGRAVVLVKPQFEAGRGKVGKNGVVRDREVHREVLAGAARFAVGAGFALEHMDFSPITGPKGNIEFLLVLSRDPSRAASLCVDDEAEKTVAAAHLEHTNA